MTKNTKYDEGDSITVFLSKDDAEALNKFGFCRKMIVGRTDIYLHDKACEAVLS